MIVNVFLRVQSKITVMWETQWEGMGSEIKSCAVCELIEAEPWLLLETLYSENRTSNWLEFTKAGGGRVQKRSKRSATEAPQGQQQGNETGRNQCPEGRQSGSCAKVSGQVTKQRKSGSLWWKEIQWSELWYIKDPRSLGARKWRPELSRWL